MNAPGTKPPSNIYLHLLISLCLVVVRRAYYQYSYWGTLAWLSVLSVTLNIKSLCLGLKVSEVALHSCTVDWSPVKLMGRDVIVYVLQLQRSTGKDVIYHEVRAVACLHLVHFVILRNT